ncbi:hypothetical protein [Rubritalea tangerina]|uniref:N-methyl-D-aspartate receptor NMDAR2C subunit n=1 Tax=Rubritalea tangerina TaxID=430798 RepID=A0ABW4Z6D1_9BACT
MLQNDSILPLLESRWSLFANRTQLPHPHKMWDAIATLHTSPERTYHNIHHVADCLEKFDDWPDKPTDSARDAIELAIWFHDIIYDSRRADNEDSSAALLTHFIRGHALETEAIALIMATEHKEASGMRSEEIICDIDLSILGATPETYTNYATAIRSEYDWVDPETYQQKRTQVLNNFLQRENIYHTEHGRNAWQAQAQSNLQSEIKQLAHPTS